MCRAFSGAVLLFEKNKYTPGLSVELEVTNVVLINI
jgi:hypothetical protein